MCPCQIERLIILNISRGWRYPINLEKNKEENIPSLFLSRMGANDTTTDYAGCVVKL